MTAQSDLDIEDKIRTAAETAEAQDLRTRIDFAIDAYLAFLNKVVPGYRAVVQIASPQPVEGATITVFHPFQQGRHH